MFFILFYFMCIYHLILRVKYGEGYTSVLYVRVHLEPESIVEACCGPIQWVLLLLIDLFSKLSEISGPLRACQ